MQNVDSGWLAEVVAHYERTFTCPELFPEYNDARNEQMRREVARRLARVGKAGTCSMASRNAERSRAA